MVSWAFPLNLGIRFQLYGNSFQLNLRQRICERGGGGVFISSLKDVSRRYLLWLVLDYSNQSTDYKDGNGDPELDVSQG